MTTSGIKNLRKVQLGRESTALTSVAASTIWRGPAIMPVDEQVKVMPEENIGFSSMVTRQYTPKKLASMAFPSTPATFQQILHILEGGIKTVTPSQDGTGSGYIYSYPLPSGDQNTIKTYTIEGGDNKVAEEMEGAFVVDFELSGKKNEAWMLSANWQGRQSTVSSFTGALSVPTVSEMLFNRSRLYIDDVDGTLGATQISNGFLEAKLKITTGLKAQFTGDGNLYFSFIDFIGAKATFEFTLLHNSTTAAERVKWRSDTARQIRLLIEGNTFGTAGTTYSKETFRVDMAGLYTAFGPPNDEDEGSNANKIVFECAYDSTAALFVNILDVVALSSIP
ncbi:MAG: hypothetical protein J0M11_01545 [Anaerolineae bacterium]|nr:hypothetical protein [Anaerolineae bacterium]